MTEQTGQPESLDLPTDVQQAYNTTVDAAIDEMKPGMPQEQRETTARIYTTFQRVFTALGYTPTEGGTVAELGMGSGPYLPAVQAAFHPAEHIGIEIDEGSVSAFQAAYPHLADSGAVRAIVADATDPSAISGFEQGRQVNAVVALHPDISAYGKGDEEADAAMDEFEADPTMLT